MIHLALLIVSFVICLWAFCVSLAIIRRYWKLLLTALAVIALGIAGVIGYAIWSDQQTRQEHIAAAAIHAPEGAKRGGTPQVRYRSLSDVPTDKLIAAYRRAADAQDDAAMDQIAEALGPRLIDGYPRTSDARAAE